MNFIEIDKKERQGEWSMSSLQSHSYYELYFLTEGERRFFLKDKIFNISAPTVCIIPPFCMHKTEGGAYKRINVNVSEELLAPQERAMLYELGKQVVFTPEKEKWELITKLLYSGADVGSAGEDKTIAESFLHVLLYLVKKDGLLPCADEENGEADDSSLVMQVVSYIHSHYMKPITIKSLCDKFYVSKNTLCTNFKSVINCSVMEYLRLVRINKAKGLLMSTRRSMKKIAEECGFSSANYFSLIFKEEVGISPLNYRKSK